MRLSRCILLVQLVALGAGAGCAKKSEPVPNESVAPLPSPPQPPPVVQAPSVSAEPPPPPAPVEVPVPGPAAVAAGASGTLKVEPNPVPVCDKTGLGTATVKWTLKGTNYAEIRVDSPDGTLFVAAKANGTQKTGLWVRKETTFYLLNGGDRRAESLMARVTPDVVAGGACK